MSDSPLTYYTARFVDTQELIYDAVPLLNVVGQLPLGAQVMVYGDGEYAYDGAFAKTTTGRSICINRVERAICDLSLPSPHMSECRLYRVHLLRKRRVKGKGDEERMIAARCQPACDDIELIERLFVCEFDPENDVVEVCPVRDVTFVLGIPGRRVT